VAEDVLEVHHHDKNHNNNAFDNLRLMHGHCHDIVHGSRCQ
jgi:RNA-directed DNA polymerase